MYYTCICFFAVKLINICLGMSGTTLTLVTQAGNKINEKCCYFQIAIPCETVDCNVIKRIKIGSFKGKNKNTPIHKSGLLSKVLSRELTIRN